MLLARGEPAEKTNRPWGAFIGRTPGCQSLEATCGVSLPSGPDSHARGWSRSSGRPAGRRYGGCPESVEVPSHTPPPLCRIACPRPASQLDLDDLGVGIVPSPL